MTTTAPAHMRYTPAASHAVGRLASPRRRALSGAGWGVLLSAPLATGLFNFEQHLLPWDVLTFAAFALAAFLFISLWEGVAARRRSGRALFWLESLPAVAI